MSFYSQRRNKISTQKKVSKTNQVVALAAEEHANRNGMAMAIPVVEKIARCSVPFVLHVVKRQLCHLNQLVTDQSIAGIVSRPDGKFPNNIAVLGKGLVLDTNPFFLHI